MKPPGSLLGPGLHKQIKDTIAKVDGLPIGGDVIRIPTELGQAGLEANTSKVFRIATFTGSWSIGETKSVRLTQNTSQTVNATNLFFPISGSTATSSSINCAVARDGTAWYLIDVPLATATAVIVSSVATATFISSHSTSQATYITNISAKLNTNDCTIAVSTTTSSATLVAINGTQTMTFVQQTYTATFLTIQV